MNPADAIAHLYARLADALTELDDAITDPTTPLITQHTQETP